MTYPTFSVYCFDVMDGTYTCDNPAYYYDDQYLYWDLDIRLSKDAQIQCQHSELGAANAKSVEPRVNPEKTEIMI